MENSKGEQGLDLTIRDLYPHLDENRLREAEENLERYVELVLRMYQRIQVDPEAYERFKTLTASQEVPTMEG